MAKFVTQIDLEVLPQRAIDLYAAREIQRSAQWYRKAVRRATLGELFEQLVAELEAAKPQQRTLLRLAGQFDALVEQLDGGPPRFAPVSAAAVWRAPAKERGIAGSLHLDAHDLHWMDKARVRKDEELWRKARAVDLRTLQQIALSQLAKMRADDLGPLWPGEEPRWVAARWPTQRAARKRRAREWGDDRPAWRVRGAPLRRCSRRLPEALLEVFDAGPFEACYIVHGSLKLPEAKPGTRVVPFLIVQANGASVMVRSCHRFRRPCAREDLARLARHAAGSGRLSPLSAFYREHDGALLYAPEGFTPADAPIEIVGMAQQERARDVLLYDVQQWDIDDHERVPAFLARLGVPDSQVHVLALAGDLVFVVPLAGRHCGRVIRVTKSGVCSEFAPDAVTGLARMSSQVVGLAREQRVAMAAQGSDDGVPMLRLKSVGAAKLQKKTPHQRGL